MSDRTPTEKILTVEILGLLAITALLWLDEVLDLPHFLFGVEPTPINWSESLLESVLVMVLGVGIVRWTAGIMARVRHLEGFVHMCSRCKRVRVGERWVPVEGFLSEQAPVTIYGGLCEHCLEEQEAVSGDRPG